MAYYVMEVFNGSMSCGHHSGTSYMIVGILHCCSAAISFISCLLVIGLIILFKKYRFSEQRLILYLSVTALVYSLAAALTKTDFTTISSLTEDYCKWIGFISQYTQWSLLLAVAIITFDIMLRVISERSTQPLEISYIVIITLFPATFNWVPFLWDLYGPSGTWCWIKTNTLNNSNECVKNEKGIILQFSLWYGPLFLVLVAILVTYIFIIPILRCQRQKMNTYDLEEIRTLNKMRQEVLVLLWYPIIYMIINLFPLVNRIVYAATDKPIFVLWILHAIISPLQGGFIAIVYALDPETRKKLNWWGICGACYDLCPCLDKHTVQEYGAIVSNERKSEKINEPLLARSNDDDQYDDQ